MREKIEAILAKHRIMTLATNRPDGWPQATQVCFIAEGLSLFCLISRRGQKYANLQADNRVSIAMGSDFGNPTDIQGLSMAGRANELTDEPYLSQFVDRLARSHNGYFDPAQVLRKSSALMRIQPILISVVDFSQGHGHADTVSVGADGLCLMQPAQPADWGPAPKPLA